MNRGECQQGFTLLELLIAIAIFALLAAIAFVGLDALIRQRSELEAHYRRLHSLQLAYEVMQRDLGQAVARPVRDPLGGQLAAMQGEPDGHALAFTRAGYPDPAGVRRSRLVRVGYRLEGHRLWRLQWPVLDQAPGEQPERSLMLEHVRSLRFRFENGSDPPVQGWPPSRGAASLYSEPRAVRVDIRFTTRQAPVTWLIALP